MKTPVQIIKEVIGQSGTTKCNAAEFIDFWTERFSIQLQKCNAIESSLKSYLHCLKTTDVISLPPSTSVTSWYWRLCLYTVAFKCSPHFVLHKFQF